MSRMQAADTVFLAARSRSGGLVLVGALDILVGAREIPVEELFPAAASEEIEEQMRSLLRAYRRSLPVERRRLLEGYRYRHMARRVGGVGSVGTRTWIVLLTGRDGDDPLFLQVKEAGPSVLERYTGLMKEIATAGV